MKTRAEINARLHGWIVAACGRIPAQDLAEDTPLFASGILKSIHVVELICLVEELLDQPLDLGLVEVGSFGSISAISHAFFPGAIE